MTQITIIPSDATQEAIALLVQKAGSYDMLAAKLTSLLKRHCCIPVDNALYFIDTDPKSVNYGARLGERQFFDTEPEALVAGLEWVMARLEQEST